MSGYLGQLPRLHMEDCDPLWSIEPSRWLSRLELGTVSVKQKLDGTLSLAMLCTAQGILTQADLTKPCCEHNLHANTPKTSIGEGMGFSAWFFKINGENCIWANSTRIASLPYKKCRGLQWLILSKWLSGEYVQTVGPTDRSRTSPKPSRNQI